MLDFYWLDPIEAAKRLIIKPHDCSFVSVRWDYDKGSSCAKLCEICLNISNYSYFRCFAQSGSWPAVPASFMNAGLITMCFTCSQRNRFSECCLSYQLVKQDSERFHTACGSTRRILSALHSIQDRGQVTEAGGGISTRGP